MDSSLNAQLDRIDCIPSLQSFLEEIYSSTTRGSFPSPVLIHRLIKAQAEPIRSNPPSAEYLVKILGKLGLGTPDAGGDEYLEAVLSDGKVDPPSTTRVHEILFVPLAGEYATSSMEMRSMTMRLIARMTRRMTRDVIVEGRLDANEENWITSLHSVSPHLIGIIISIMDHNERVTSITETMDDRNTLEDCICVMGRLARKFSDEFLPWRVHSIILAKMQRIYAKKNSHVGLECMKDGFEILSNMCGKGTVNDDLLYQGVVTLLEQCFGVIDYDTKKDPHMWSLLSNLFRFSYIFARTPIGKKRLLEGACVFQCSAHFVKHSASVASHDGDRAPASVVLNAFKTMANLCDSTIPIPEWKAIMKHLIRVYHEYEDDADVVWSFFAILRNLSASSDHLMIVCESDAVAIGHDILRQRDMRNANVMIAVLGMLRNISVDSDCSLRLFKEHGIITTAVEVLEENQSNDALQDAGMSFLRNVGSRTYTHEMLIQHGIMDILKHAFDRILSDSMGLADVGITICTLRNLASGTKMHRLIIEGGFLSSVDMIVEKYTHDMEILGQSIGTYQNLSATKDHVDYLWGISSVQNVLRLLTTYGGENINVMDRSLAFFWNMSILDSVKEFLIFSGIVDLTLQLMRKAIPTRIDFISTARDIPADGLDVLKNGLGLLANLVTSALHRPIVFRKDVIAFCFEVFQVNESIPLVHLVISQACRLVQNASNDLTIAQELMSGGIFNVIMHLMEKFRTNAAVVRDACGILINLSRDQEAALLFMRSGIMSTFKKLMTTHEHDTELMKNMTGILVNMLKSEEISSAFIEQGILDKVFRLMILHSTHSGLQEYCLRVGINITSIKKNAAQFITMGGITHVIRAMNTFPLDEDVQKSGLSVLLQAALPPESKRRLLEMEGIVPLVQKTIERFADCPTIHNQGIRVLVNLAVNDANAIDLARRPIISMVASSMQKHMGDQNVVIAGLMLMQNICANQSHAQVVLSCGGAMLIKSVMERYPSDTSVLRPACSCLSNMCKERDAALAIGMAGLIPSVLSAVKTFQKDADIAKFGGAVLQKVAEAQEMRGQEVESVTVRCELRVDF